MSRSVSIDEMASAIIEGLEEYADLSAQGVKSAVRKSAKAVKEQINSSAPVRTGRYAKSWAVKTTAESSQSLEQTVYSPSRYMLSHLLEKGHAKRGGGSYSAHRACGGDGHRNAGRPDRKGTEGVRRQP